MKSIKLCIMLLLVLFVGNVFAVNFCSDMLIDEVSVINSGQAEQVTKTADKLTRQGVEVKIRVFGDLKGYQSLDALKASAQQKCGSWQSKNSGMKNNLLVIMVAPKQSKTGFYYGDALASKLDSKQLAIQSEMNSKFRDGNIAGGIVNGLTNVSDLMDVKMSQQGASVTINHAADMSVFGSIFGWLAAIGVLAVLAWVGFLFWRDKENRRNAQRKAKTEQSRCTTAINGFETPYALLLARIKKATCSDAKKARLQDALSAAQGQYNQAATELSAVNRANNNPDTPNLSVREYEEIAARFTKIAERLTSVMRKLNEIEAELSRPEADTRVEVVPSRYVKPAAPQSEHKVAEGHVPPVQPTSKPEAVNSTSVQQQSSATATSAQPVVHEHHTTTIVTHDCGSDFVTGMVLGEMLSEDRHRHNDDLRRQESPGISVPQSDARATDGGGSETGWGKTSEGSGSETEWGKTSDGSGAETSWRSPDFGAAAVAVAEVAQAEPRDCDCQPADCVKDCDCKPADCVKDCDCAPSDCKASDCAASDCNCDCNCDCSGPSD